MFRFEYPIYLWLLTLIPLLAFIRFWGWRQRIRKLRKFGDIQLLKELMPDVSKYRPTIKFWLLEAALTLLIIMLARPQMGTKISREKRNGIETIICLDISNSMLAQDVTPSRLQKSKMLIENLVDHFTNDKIGLIVFAGDAFVQLPITSDYVSAKMFLQNIDPSLIDMQGTDIARALSLASNSFTQQEKIGRAIIVITDGEDHEGGALEAAQAAKKRGMNVFILGVGDSKGSPIPDGQGGYMRDGSNQVVMTALNQEMCQQIAQAGSGKYIHVDNTSDAQEALNDELARLQKGENDSVIYSEYDEQFQAFGILVLLLLIVEICILESKNPLAKRINIFKRKTVKPLMIIVLLCMTCPSAFAQADRQHIRQGNRLFHQEDYAKAEVEYQKALTANENNPEAMYNLGCAMMMQQKDSAAVIQFERAGKKQTSKKRKAQAYHNIGWICQKHQLYGEAIEAYKESLRNNPDDHETRYNLALCMRQQKNNQQNSGNNNQDKKEEQNKDKNQQKDQQKEKQEQQQSPPKEQMSKENAEQLLNAAIQEEKATQQRMKKNQQHPNRKQLPKNW